MTKPKKFNEKEVLERLIHLFREKGFSNVSMKEIEKSTKLKPGSLYNAFGNKQNLFRRVVETYNNAIVKHRIEKYLKKGNQTFHKRIKSFFESTFLIEDRVNFGCLLTNSSLEVSALDHESISVIQQGLSKIESAFLDLSKEAVSQGELTSLQTPENIAKLMLAQYQGILTLAKLGTNRNDLKRITKTFLESL